MTGKANLLNAAIAHFDQAAPSYESAATMQAQVARHLIERAARSKAPPNILDIGCGTGLVAKAAAESWPQARLTALDAAPAMLAQAQQKIPDLQLIQGDAATIELNPRYDLILSSMMLHWLPDPLSALRRWQAGLTPHGKLHVALLVQGSFNEWRDLCAAHGVAPGLWPLPTPEFAAALNPQTMIEDLTITYANAHDFLRRLKTTGAATPRPGHQPLPVGALRKMLHEASRDFTVTYRVLYIELAASGSV